jgi:tetratricopeptide (TPR) repeat protein
MRQMIATIRALLVLLAFAAPLPAFATDYADSAALDELFAELKSAPSAAEAADVTEQIWNIWFSPTVPELKARMNRASAAMGAGDLDAALDQLTAIVTDYPDYAEGWNQRATLYYMLDNFDASLADIDKVLALEPRHFGALSGRISIYLRQGKRPQALRDMIAALAIDPYLSQKALFPELSPNTTNV